MCGQRSEKPKTTREKRPGLCMHSQSRLDELKSTFRRRWLSFETGPCKVRRRPICREAVIRESNQAMSLQAAPIRPSRLETLSFVGLVAENRNLGLPPDSWETYLVCIRLEGVCPRLVLAKGFDSRPYWLGMSANRDIWICSHAYCSSSQPSLGRSRSAETCSTPYGARNISQARYRYVLAITVN